MKNKDEVGIIKLLRFLTSRNDKLMLIFLFLLSVVLSWVETLTISLLMPLVSMASNPDYVLKQRILSKVYEYLHFTDVTHFVYFFGFCMICFYIFRILFNMFYTFVLNIFSLKKYRYFALSLFKKALGLPYLKFVDKGQDAIRNNITSNAMAATDFVKQTLTIASELIMLVTLYSMLLAINVKMTLVLTFIIAMQIFIILKTVTKKITKQGRKSTKIDEKFFKILSRGFGNFILLKLNNKSDSLVKNFEIISKQKVKTQIINGILMPLPKMILETMGFIIIVLSVMYILFRYGSASAVIPTLSMYALALYRFLPSVNNLIGQYNSIKSKSLAINLIYKELSEEDNQEGNDPIDFTKKIELKNIDFTYKKEEEGNFILKDFNLTIEKGDKIAFTGPSGAGKSTAVNIIIGIIAPTSGEILVDGKALTIHNVKSWRNKIGYIPQQIYLFDGTIAQNIVFGGEFNKDKIIDVCKKAKIYDFIAQYDGIFTVVGEGGVKLSGGQRQRIGIARALYEDPEILVLDEATSALDNETESKIMDEIYTASVDKTLLVIAHRLSTIEKCNKKITISSLSGAS